MVDKKYDGCHNCKYLAGDFCDELLEHVDMWFQEGCGESLCDFDYWKKMD